MNVSAPFINRPVMTTFVMLTIIIAGVVAFFQLPVSDLPTVEKQNIQIKTGYTGASPEAVLNHVTIPLEKELTHIKGLEEITSTSSSGNSSIKLSFALSKDMNVAIRDVQSAINTAEASLPIEVDSRPTYHLQEGSQEPIMFMLLTSDEASVGDLRTYADAYIIPRLTRLEGVAQVMTYGPEKSIWIKINPELMAARQVGFNQVINAVRQHTKEMPLGSIQTGSKRLSIELPHSVKQAKDLENIAVGTNNVKLKDIAEISSKSGQDRDFRFVTQEKTSTALILGVLKVSDGNTVAISKAVHSVLASIDKGLPPSINLKLWFDKAVWIEESLIDVQWSLVFAFILVVIVIYLSLGRFTESMVASAALPLSLVGTFAIMYLAEFSLDLLSLLALTLSVGFVVDDAIVVLENIVRWQEKGAKPHEASLMGSKQICFTILSMTLSLVAVFIPLLFMQGMNGRLFREFSITLAVAILISGFVSLSLTPMLCSRFLKPHQRDNGIQKSISSINNSMTSFYGMTLKKCFKIPKTIFVIALSSIAATVFLFGKLPVSLIPPEDRGFFFAFVNLPTGMAQTEIKEQQSKLEAIIKKNPHIENFLDLNFDDKLFFIMRLHPIDKRPPQSIIMKEIQAVIDAIPGTQTFMQPYQLINLDMSFGNPGQYKLVLRGLEFDDVENADPIVIAALRANPQFLFVQSSLKNDSPVLAMNVDEDLANKYGFQVKDIQEILQHAYGQASVGSIQKGVTKENIYMELLPEYQSTSNAPSKLYLSTNDGNAVPLKAIVDWHERLGSPTLVRRDQLPSSTIRFSLVDGIDPKEGLRVTEEIVASVLPGNVTATLDGAAKAVTSTINHTLFLLLAAAVVMYIVLGILYESFIHPLTILSSLPLAGLGGVLTLFIFNEPISIFSAVGFLLLIGIVKKNGIMMVDYAIEAEKTGKTSQEAIYDACLVRFRPIMMTTVVAIMGAIPIAIGFGDSGEMRRGLGLVIVGGLLFSQMLTLYVTPILYLTFNRRLRANP